MPEPELAPDIRSNDSSEDAVEDRTTDEPADDEKTVRCDNCRNPVNASASTCSDWGANLDSGWFS